MTYKSRLLVLASLASSVLATPPDITFLCDEMPEICANMCWAIRCARPRFPQHLTLDFAAADIQTRRTIAAGCGNENMCSSPYGLNQTGHRGPPFVACNAYPFSSTSESTFPSGHQVVRCVPEEEQCRQRAQLLLLARKYQSEGEGRGGGGWGNGSVPRSISINFGNPGYVKYCNNDPCVNDGFEVQDVAATINKRRAEDPKFKYYKTGTGMVLASMDDIHTPSNFTRCVGRSEEILPGFNTKIENVHGDRLQMIEDIVTERVSAQDFVV